LSQYIMFSWASSVISYSLEGLKIRGLNINVFFCLITKLYRDDTTFDAISRQTKKIAMDEMWLLGGGIQGDVIVRRIIREMIQKQLKYLFSN